MMNLKGTLPKVLVVLAYWGGAFAAFYAVDYWFGYTWGMIFLYTAPWPLFLFLWDWRNTRRAQKMDDAKYGKMPGWEKSVLGFWHKPNVEEKINDWTHNREWALQSIESARQGDLSDDEREAKITYWTALLDGAEEELAFWSTVARWEALPQITKDELESPVFPERYKRAHNWSEVFHLLEERSFPPGYRSSDMGDE